jgi:uncharacterized membrane protein (Fun14 family)|tara:strand:- start:316 stop:654 length:339 start_codon:yes stop_codon:yes gene_type:complete
MSAASDLWEGFLGEIGVAAFQGMIVGVITGLIFKITTDLLKWFIMIEFAILKWLESRSIVIVDWERLTLGLIDIGINVSDQSQSLLVSISEMGTFGLGFFAGFAVVERFKSK